MFFAILLTILSAKAQFKHHAIQEKWHSEFAFSGPKNKIVSGVKTICNTAREYLRRTLIQSVLKSGPCRCALRPFVSTVLVKFGLDQGASAASPELVRRIALMVGLLRFVMYYSH
jgi:hypothetical protein